MTVGADVKPKTAITVLVALMILLSGCSGLTGSLTGPTASISNPEATVVEGFPAISFNYTVGDYSDVLLETPRGEVITEDTLEPENGRAVLGMGDPQPGEYKLIIQQGGETVTTESVTFEGADPAVSSISADWDRNKLNRIRVEVQNEGDLPVRIQNATYSARGKSITNGPFFQWIPPGGEETVNLTPSFGETLSIEESGDVRGTVSLQTSNGTLTGSFRKTFEGAQIEVASVSSDWSGNSLDRVSVSVQNTGDLPTSVSTELQRAGDTLATSEQNRLPAGEQIRVEIAPFESLYEASSGGTKTLDLIVKSPEGFVTKNITHRVEPMGISVVSSSQSWQNNKLESVSFTVRNTGDVPGRFTANLSVEGENIEGQTYQISAGESEEFIFTALGWLYEARSGGEKTVTLTLSTGGDSITETLTHQIEGGQLTIDSLSPEWQSGDLTKVDFSLTNTGEIKREFQTELIVNGETIRSAENTIGRDTTVDFFYEAGFNSVLYSVDSGGEYEVTVTVTSQGQTLSKSSTTEFEGVDASFSEISPSFSANFDSDTSDLTGVDFTVRNTGDITLNYDNVKISIGGAERTVSGVSIAGKALQPGESGTVLTSFALSAITVQNGEHTMTIQLLNDGEPVVSTEVTVSTDDS